MSPRRLRSERYNICFMPGKFPNKMELKCRTCGIFCIQDPVEGWKHEEQPDEPHVADVKVPEGL